MHQYQDINTYLPIKSSNFYTSAYKQTRYYVRLNNDEANMQRSNHEKYKTARGKRIGATTEKVNARLNTHFRKGAQHYVIVNFDKFAKECGVFVQRDQMKRLLRQLSNKYHHEYKEKFVNDKGTFYKCFVITQVNKLQIEAQQDDVVVEDNINKQVQGGETSSSTPLPIYNINNNIAIANLHSKPTLFSNFYYQRKHMQPMSEFLPMKQDEVKEITEKIGKNYSTDFVNSLLGKIATDEKRFKYKETFNKYVTVCLERELTQPLPKPDYLTVRKDYTFEVTQSIAAIQDPVWREIMHRLRQYYDPAIVKSWFLKLRFTRVDDNNAILSGETGFISEYVEQHYFDNIKTFANNLNINLEMRRDATLNAVSDKQVSLI